MNDQWTKRLVLVAWVVATLLMAAGCSTVQLPAGATADQRQAAMCKDAMVGQAILSQVPGFSTQANKAYWDNYRAGVDAAIKTYCAEWVVTEMTAPITPIPGKLQ